MRNLKNKRPAVDAGLDIEVDKMGDVFRLDTNNFEPPPEIESTLYLHRYHITYHTGCLTYSRFQFSPHLSKSIVQKELRSHSK